MEVILKKQIFQAPVLFALLATVQGKMTCEPTELHKKHTVSFTFSSEQVKKSSIEIESMYKPIGTCDLRTKICKNNKPDVFNITLTELDNKYTIWVTIYNVTRGLLFNNKLWFSGKYGNPFLKENLICRIAIKDTLLPFQSTGSVSRIQGPPSLRHDNSTRWTDLTMKINTSVKITLHLNSFPKPNRYIIFKKGSQTHIFENVTLGHAKSEDISIVYEEDGTTHGTLYVNFAILEQKDFTNYLIIIDNGIPPWLEYTFSIIKEEENEQIKKDDLSQHIVLGVSISTAGLCVIAVFISVYCCYYFTGSTKKNTAMDYQNTKNFNIQNDTSLSVQVNDTRVNENFNRLRARRRNREYDIFGDNDKMYTHDYNTVSNEMTVERDKSNVLDNSSYQEYEYITPTDEYPPVSVVVIESPKVENDGYISPIN